MEPYVHPALQPVVALTVKETKGTPFLDPAGNELVPPTTAELMEMFLDFRQQALGIISSQADQITNLLAQVASKATAGTWDVEVLSYYKS